MQQLTDLEVTKVAFVEEGDNKQANILFFKRKPEETAENTDTAQDLDEKGLAKRLIAAIKKAFALEKDEGADNDTDGKPNNAGGNDPQQDGGQGGENETPATDEKDTNKTSTQKGVKDVMKIDRSKLTPEEIEQLDAIEAKAGIDDTEGDEEKKKSVDKGADESGGAGSESSGGDEDIYKGLHPEVAKELKELRKRADEAEEKELNEVAKKYELLGKKPDELAKTFKTLKAAGGSAYDDMIAILDASLDTVEKSGAFSEVGRNGHGSQQDAWSQIEAKAAEIQKAHPDYGHSAAIDLACQQNPDLVRQYESER